MCLYICRKSFSITFSVVNYLDDGQMSIHNGMLIWTEYPHFKEDNNSLRLIIWYYFIGVYVYVTLGKII